jgi:hypothetical protein
MEQIVKRIMGRLDTLERDTRRLTSFTQNANIALGVQTFTVATLPTITSTGGTQIAFASNGRNPGEGAGAGTGVLVWNNGTSGWRTVYDGTAVVA